MKNRKQSFIRERVSFRNSEFFFEFQNRISTHPVSTRSRGQRQGDEIGLSCRARHRAPI
jgi:hypothetical protein